MQKKLHFRRGKDPSSSTRGEPQKARTQNPTHQGKESRRQVISKQISEVRNGSERQKLRKGGHMSTITTLIQNK